MNYSLPYNYSSIIEGHASESSRLVTRVLLLMSPVEVHTRHSKYSVLLVDLTILW